MRLKAGLPLIAILSSLSSGAISQGGGATTEGYSKLALREEREASLHFKVAIGAEGIAKDCTVTQSSGSQELDDAACKIIMKRAHFKPARNAKGEPVEDVYESRFVWRVPQ
ncbi:energy transducer TonB [Sphingobium indicum]|uniref:energy transducer TonB n=1 Tax=Sphingobium indicum TaxID=332055 RepID=UPI0009DB582E|nr:energy transducer TonB [Sphingobium indicum]